MKKIAFSIAGLALAVGLVIGTLWGAPALAQTSSWKTRLNTRLKKGRPHLR